METPDDGLERHPIERYIASKRTPDGTPWDQGDAAEHFRMSKSHLSQVLNGSRGMSARTMHRVAKISGGEITLVDLVTWQAAHLKSKAAA